MYGPAVGLGPGEGRPTDDLDYVKGLRPEYQHFARHAATTPRQRMRCHFTRLQERYGSHTTCHNRFVSLRQAGRRVGVRMMEALAATYDAAVHLLNTSPVRR